MIPEFMISRLGKWRANKSPSAKADGPFPGEQDLSVTAATMESATAAAVESTTAAYMAAARESVTHMGAACKTATDMSAARIPGAIKCVRRRHIDFHRPRTAWAGRPHNCRDSR